MQSILFGESAGQRDELPIHTKSNRGGARANSGRKTAAQTRRDDKAAVDAGSVARNISLARKEAAMAEKEETNAKRAALEYEIQSNNYLPRDAIIRATATAYASLVQSLRAIPDQLERRLGLDPVVTQQVEIHIDEALEQIALEFERMMEASK